ncbi:carbohydrate esterase family 4 protein [Lasiosphaeris hirsuta]|uniref:Carbohydrate esterase family 4 protein n=1 Tax=Lasiosphaeris hirsuta TaxID=260670 RepID=A0AA40AFC4_9PEZI|nr:carbohydrate esterase family 4 protein [Lasiosphaeris hirsuta]
MLFDRRLVAGLAGLWTASTASAAACTADLLIDNFVKWTAGTNNLDWQNGDDGSMTSIAASAGQVVFTPKDASSYFYESFPCVQAQSSGYTGINFSIQGPAGASVALELQTASTCDASSNYTSSYNIVSDLTGQRQVISLPLLGFDNNPNYDAIVGLVWSVFSKVGSQWSIGNVTLACGGTATVPSVSTSVTAVPSRTTVAVPTTALTTASRSTVAPAQPTGCTNLLIDDWESQSRLTFLGYNALGQSSSDDGTMASIVVSSKRVMLTPTNLESYFYSQFGCLNTANKYGGISFRIRAARGTTFAVTLAWFDQCGSTNIKTFTQTTAQLKWTFDGTERLYWFPLSIFTGIDSTKLDLIYFSNFNAAVILGPMSFYCGNTATEYVIPAVASSAPIPRQTSSTPVSNAKTFVIDAFANKDSNALGEWHGSDEGKIVTQGNNFIAIQTNDSDLSWNTQLTNKCADLRAYSGAYLHIAYSGSNKFSVALQQHNAKCNDAIAPFPETWDSLEAARYASATDIYMPINHFNVNLTRTIGFNLRGFYSNDPTYLTKIEIVDKVPNGWVMPSKLPSGKLVFACTRPNSFAFAIDDGEPKYAARVMEMIKQANIPVTFFTVGLPLLDTTNGLAKIYKDMAARGHQIALHSYTHPKMEGLPDDASIDWEYNNDIGAVKQVFGDTVHTNYFRPPFGTEGARMRQRLAATLNDPNAYLVEWSVDVEDWRWAETTTPQKQLEAFKRDLAKGGNLVVMHYLYNSTVNYIPEFIKLAKATGKTLMRVDQCMEDPNAPPLKAF